MNLKKLFSEIGDAENKSVLYFNQEIVFLLFCLQSEFLIFQKCPKLNSKILNKIYQLHDVN